MIRAGLATTNWGAYLIALIFGLGVVIAYQSLFQAIRYPYSADSAAYIEQARNLNGGRGLYSTPNGPYPLDSDFERTAVFPPGYPIAIAWVSRLGIEEGAVAPWLNRLAAALLPAAMVFGFGMKFGTARILPAAALVTLSPGVLTFQYMALADAIFLLLAVLSIGLVVRVPHFKAAFLVSGALAGLAYCFRNAGAALLLAVPAALVASALLRLYPRRRCLSHAVLWATGAAIFVLPLVAFNLAVFGAAQPYDMPPSTIGLLSNAGMFVAAQVADLLGFRLLSQLSALYDAILILLLLGALGLAWITALAWPRLMQHDKVTVILLACYALAGAAMVILSRTRYHWGETISIRHAMQYSWAIIILLLVVVGVLTNGVSPRRRAIAMRGVILALIALRIADIFGAGIRPRESTRLTRAVSDNQALLSQVLEIPPSAMVCSNVATVLRIALARPARQVQMNGLDATSLQTVERLASEITPHRPVYFVLALPRTAHAQPTVPAHAVQWLSSIGAEVIVNRPDFAVFRFPKGSA